MSYNLAYTRRAEKDIKKLDPSIRRQIGKAILKLQDNPLEHSENLADRRTDMYKRDREEALRVLVMYQETWCTPVLFHFGQEGA